MNVFGQIWAKLAGKKTYLIVGAFVLCLILEKGFGLDVPFFAVGDDWLNQLAVMLGFGAVRSGIAK